MKTITVGRGRSVRVGPWRGEEEVASIATFIDQPLDSRSLSPILQRLDDDGYKRVITAALTVDEQQAFIDCDFSPLRRLALLRRPLDNPVTKTERRLRRWRWRRYDDILRIDEAAFDSFWRFDETALREALDATPHRILRVDASSRPDGYALSGVAGSRAYLQRLAVDPAAAGKGLGTALLLDALRWMRWRGAEQAYVNTQFDNERALALYEHHGFTPEPDGLTIFHRDL